ncbi:MAG TPA: NAD(+)/NADH kinase [Thermodesulfobacteriota bacterium]|nr:NAD(+)/NADH kinase [Thermodesulfobacteriota bacterium]
MKKVGVIVKLNKPEVVRVSQDVIKWLLERGVEVYLDTELAGKLNYSKSYSRADIPGLVELMIVLGGDGTMLYTARLIGEKKVPILGVNLGSLGFLTAITMKEIYPVLERVIKDDFETEERMMLSVQIRRGEKVVSTYTVLNDVVIKGTLARLINLEARINKEYVTTYRADGLIISTPTGSTAYSLSAGGPILYPTIHSIILAPICPFTLTNRPVVIPDWMTVEILIKPEQQHDVLLTLDGQVDLPLTGGDIIEIKRSDACMYLVKCPGKSYFDILRERLMWGGK